MNLENSVSEIDSIRQRWKKDTQALLPNFRNAFNLAFNKATKDMDQVLQHKIEVYQKEIEKIEAASLRDWNQALANARSIYLKDVLKQGLIWASGVTAIALLAVGSISWWGSSILTKQQIYKEFGGESMYDTMLYFNRLGDNPDLLLRCKASSNPKCTVWIADPKSLSTE